MGFNAPVYAGVMVMTEYLKEWEDIAYPDGHRFRLEPVPIGYDEHMVWMPRRSEVGEIRYKTWLTVEAPRDVDAQVRVFEAEYASEIETLRAAAREFDLGWRVVACASW